MSRPGHALTATLMLLGACSAPPEITPLRTASGPPEASEIVFQAVDAGTGAALADDDLTVRYLVRAPITVDATATEAVPATEPYHIRHEVAEDSLVVEVRLEAPSYHTLDTVLAVPRGASAGPLTLRMARRLERTAAEAEPSPPEPQRPAPPSKPAETAPAKSAPRPSTPPPSSASAERTAMEAGDQAFRAGRWRAAVDAYDEMTAPGDRSSAYAAAYEAALVRKGIANINLGAYGGAIEALREAVGMGLPDARAHLRLAQAECAVGRITEGKQTLEGIRTMGASIPDRQKPLIRALAEYRTGVCTQGEIEKAPTTIGRVRVGSQAVREFQAFFQTAAGISPSPPELDAAVADAHRRVEQIRQKMRGGGDGA